MGDILVLKLKPLNVHPSLPLCWRQHDTFLLGSNTGGSVSVLCPPPTPWSPRPPSGLISHISYLTFISYLYIEHPLLLEYDFCPLSKAWCSSLSPCFNISTILFMTLNSTGIIQYSEKYSTMNSKYTWVEERFFRGVLRQEPILKITEATLIAPMIHLPPVSPASSL